MRRFLAPTVILAICVAASAGHAQTIYPIDRADILVGAHFDFKVEFPGLADAGKLGVTVNGEDYAKVFGKAATFVEREDGKDQSALLLRDVSLAQPGTYKVKVTDGSTSREITWTVFDTGPRKAKNVILFIGDGMSAAHRTAARLLSKGIAEGKANGKLAIDDMPHMALVATAGSDSIITNSANSASAYATGHKSAVNAMGVYADRTAKPVRRSAGRDHHQPGQAPAEPFGRRGDQHRDRRRHPRRHDRAYAPALDLREHRRAVLCRQARRADGRRFAQLLPARQGGRRTPWGRRRLCR